MATLAAAVTHLAATLAALTGKSVVYARGANSVILTAVKGRTEREAEDAEGFTTIVQAEDFILQSADLVLGGSATTPAPGDTILETLGGAQITFTVCPIPGEPCYRYCDPLRQLLRIHTKEGAGA